MDLEKRNMNFEDIAVKILLTSKQELYIEMRYLLELLNFFSYKMDKSTFFVGTQGDTILFNPLMIAKKYKENPVIINRAYLHMVLHCMFKHVFIGGKIAIINSSNSTNNTDITTKQGLWNVACDIAVEYIIDGMEENCVKRLVPSQREKIYEILKKECGYPSAENVYRYLLKCSQLEQQKWIYSDTFLSDDHKYWYDEKQKKDGDNKSEQQENDEQQDGDSEQNDSKESQSQSSIIASESDMQDKWEKLGNKLMTELTTFGTGMGKEQKRLIEGVGLIKKKSYSYKEFLRKFAIMTEEMHVDMESFDYGFYNYGIQTYGNLPLIEELEYKEERRIETFVIVIDTSGSCSGEAVKTFLEETYSVLKEREYFAEKINLHIIQCDNAIQSDSYISDLAELEV